MRTVIALSVSVAYWLVVTFAYLLTVLQCGMGPDSPETCNLSADEQGQLVIATAALVYLIGLIVFWRRRHIRNK